MSCCSWASLVLLVSATLFVGRLETARDVDVGFDAENVLAVSFDLTTGLYDEEGSEFFHRALTDAVLNIPTVETATAPAYAPFFSRGAASLHRAGIPVGDGGGTGDGWSVVAFGVAPDYFRTLGIPLVAGRPLGEDDMTTEAPVAVVSESLARLLWPDQSAVGRAFVIDRNSIPIQVVGVAANIVFGDLFEPDRPLVIVPHTQRFRPFVTSLLVRTSGDPADVIPAVRAAVRRLDPGVPIVDLGTLQERIDAALAGSRAVATAISVLGILALVLAAVGLHGVLAFLVAGRTREIGIRMALGARMREVVARVVREAAVLACFGVGLGAVLSLVTSRILISAVPGIGAVHSTSLLGAAALFVAVAVMASWLPARRAAGVDPARVLQEE